MSFADNVLETTTTTGTGDLVLAGPPTNFRSFLAAFSAGAQVYYVVNDSAAGGTSWEVGRGTLQDGPARIVRDQVLASSNAGGLVDWPAGDKRIWNGPPGDALLGILTDHAGATEPAIKPRGVRWLDTSVNPYLWKVYDGSAWVTFGSVDPTGHHFVPYYNGAPLPGPGTAEGDVPVLQAGGLLDPDRVPLLSAATELTIASGVITPTGKYHSVDTEADAAEDEVVTVSTTGIAEGGLVVFRAENAARVPTFRDGIGNLNLAAGDFALAGLSKRLTLQRRGAEFDEFARSAPSGVWEEIQTQKVTGSVSSVDFTGIPTSAYRFFEFRYSGVRGSADATMSFRTRRVGQGSYDAGATDYRHGGAICASAGAALQGAQSSGASAITLGQIDSPAIASCDGIIAVSGLDDSTKFKKFIVTTAHSDQGQNARWRSVAAEYKSNSEAIDAVRFRLSTGTFEAGEFVLLGMRQA